MNLFRPEFDLVLCGHLNVVLIITLTLLGLLTSKYSSPSSVSENKIRRISVGVVFAIYAILLLSFFIYNYRVQLSDFGLLVVSVMSIFNDILRLMFFRFKRSFAGIIRDGVANFLIFSGVYLVSTYTTFYATDKIAFILLLLWRIGRTLKFRFALHPFIQAEEVGDTPKSYYEQSLLILQPLGDYLLRTITHVVLSGALLCVVLFFDGSGPVYQSNKFFTEPQAGTQTVITTMLYFVFVISHTVGFGDVVHTNDGSRAVFYVWIMFFAIFIGAISVQMVNLSILTSRKILPARGFAKKDSRPPENDESV